MRQRNPGKQTYRLGKRGVVRCPRRRARAVYHGRQPYKQVQRARQYLRNRRRAGLAGERDRQAGARGVGVEMVDRRAPRHGAFHGVPLFPKGNDEQPDYRGRGVQTHVDQVEEAAEALQVRLPRGVLRPLVQRHQQKRLQGNQAVGERSGRNCTKSRRSCGNARSPKWCAGGTTCTSG